jgi:hypothetical protein
MSSLTKFQINSKQTLSKNPCYVGSAASARLTIKSFSGLRASGMLTRQGLVPNLGLISQRRSQSVQGRSRHVVYALFEKFTERSIKSVMLAQEWARNNGELEARVFEL